jgi:hypothetical protein
MSAATTSGPMAVRLRHLPVPLAISGVLLVLATALGWFVVGPLGAAGAAIGVVTVAVSYLVSSVAVAWADSVAPSLIMTVGLTSYVLKFALLGVVFFAVPNGWPGTRAMALAMVVTVIAWITAQIWWTLKAKIPSVDYHPPTATDYNQ